MPSFLDILRVSAVTALLVLITAVAALWSPIPVGDTRLYSAYSDAIWNGAIPYRDLLVEYPPGVLPFILLAQPIGQLLGSYITGFMLLAALAVGAVLWDQYKHGGQKALLIAALLLLPILQFVFFQLDVFAAAALYFALRTLKQEKLKLSGALFGLATLIKGYPIVCLPAYLLALKTNQRRPFLATLATVITVGVLPFILISPSGILETVTYHTERPIQIESAPAAIGLIINLFGAPISAVESHASTSLQFTGAEAIKLLSSVFLLLAVAAVTFGLFRSKVKNKPATASIALLLVYLITFKVGSPQFILPVILLSFLAINEFGLKYWRHLLLRLLTIGIIIYLGMQVLYRELHTQIQFKDGALLIIKWILITELLIWVLHRLGIINFSRLRKKIPAL